MKAKTNAKAILGLTCLLCANTALAGQADSSATAGSRGRRSGTAAATAGYSGNGIGLTRTDTRTGNVNFAHGLAVGLDEDGLTLSSSYALAPRRGPAVAATFNLGIGTDGSVTTGVGRTVAEGSRSRTVDAGGSVTNGNRRTRPTAVVTTGGKTGPTGRVFSRTSTQTRRGSDAHRRTPPRRTPTTRVLKRR